MTPTPRYEFASDNTAGISPDALAVLTNVNTGAHAAYGEDQWTLQAQRAVAKLFDSVEEVFFLVNGTAANALALAAICQPYHAVICHPLSHIDNDEANAPVFLGGGIKLIRGEGENGKLTPEEIKRLAQRRSDIHSPKVRAISLTQATEAGTVYTLEELRELIQCAHELGLYVHMDGSRLGNACAFLNCSPADMTQALGVDVLSLGGIKAGISLSDALIFFRAELAHEFAWRRKQAAHLVSKMRYLAASWAPMLEKEYWQKYARHANAMAKKLAICLCDLPGVELIYPVEANIVFVRLPAAIEKNIRAAGWVFYSFLGGGDSRFVCSWNTQESHIQDLINAARQAI